MESVTNFFTSDNGLVQTVVVIVGLISGVLAIYASFRSHNKEIKDDTAGLTMSTPVVTQPPPYSEAGEISFQLMNNMGSKAVMTTLLLIVDGHRASEKVKVTQVGAGVPELNFKVKLNPDVREYDVRKKRFGKSPGPRSYDKNEVESIVIELTSTIPQYYEFHLDIEWYDVAISGDIHHLKSEILNIEFSPEAARQDEAKTEVEVI